MIIGSITATLCLPPPPLMTDPRVWKYGPSLRAYVKTKGLVFHSSARAFRLINDKSHGQNGNILKIHQELADDFPTNLFHKICPESFSQGFPMIFKFPSIVRDHTENFREH